MADSKMHNTIYKYLINKIDCLEFQSPYVFPTARSQLLTVYWKSYIYI